MFAAERQKLTSKITTTTEERVLVCEKKRNIKKNYVREVKLRTGPGKGKCHKKHVKLREGLRISGRGGGNQEHREKPARSLPVGEVSTAQENA